MKLPNLIIIGAMKAGTTSLHYYLNLHPEVSMSDPKELEFFSDDRRWKRGIEWYGSHFDPSARVRGESSPQYSLYPAYPGVAERMASVIPDAKLIYLVRDPVERLISQWRHAHARGFSEPVDEFFQDVANNRHVIASRYHMQLTRYLEHYPRSRILVISAEDLRRRRRATLRRVFDFIDVDPDFESWRVRFSWNESRHRRRKTAFGSRLEKTIPWRLLEKLPHELRGVSQEVLSFPFSRAVPLPPVAPEARRQLVEALRDDVEALRQLTGEPFDEWCL